MSERDKLSIKLTKCFMSHSMLHLDKTTDTAGFYGKNLHLRKGLKKIKAPAEYPRQ